MGAWFRVFTAGKEYCLTLNTFFFTHKSRGFTGLSAIDFFEREGGLSRGKKEGSFVKQPSALAQRHKARVL